ncbi:MAG: 4-alpha-glucanotransferase, partial [Lachnospiraceae bacterium]|nr:4-alpha-glucanotransferase [Lachnospiraceae bacterium]
RRMYPAFTEGDFEPFAVNDDVFGYYRSCGNDCLAVLLNRSGEKACTAEIEDRGGRAAEIISGAALVKKDGKVLLSLSPMGSAAVHFNKENGLAEKMEPGVGALLHITSLPGGRIDDEAYRFVDVLAGAGVRYWQILPLNPTDEYGSPYAGRSAFAGNTDLLPENEEELRAGFDAYLSEHALKKEDLRHWFAGAGWFTGAAVKDPAGLLVKRESWAAPYCIFTAVKKRFDEKPWTEWPVEYRSFSAGLPEDDDILYEASFRAYAQYRFDTCWKALKEYANSRGIKIIGDMPMYVALDSADVWADKRLFTIDDDGREDSCAGVPPDRFAEEGQLWGNPLYNWETMKAEGFSWWMKRFDRMFGLYDYTRLDHFRGFESYWAVPYGEKAIKGRWRFGPGEELFKKAYEKFGPLPVFAEDLGMITPQVRALMDITGFYGTDVMQFYDGDPLESYTPPERKIAYSGTHDNQALKGWCEEKYKGRDPEKCAGKLLQNLMACGADIKIIPLQDLMMLGDEARMNKPGTAGENWSFRADEDYSEHIKWPVIPETEGCK